jgi:hypothetical protein
MTGLQCLQACGGDKGCATACSAELGGSAKELLETVITCATNHACFDAQ